MLRLNRLTAIPAIALIIGGTGIRAQDAGPPPIEDHPQAVQCLALAVAYEAGYESVEGQQAVAEVVLNRLRAPSYPKTVCNVVFAGSTRRTGCQFTFTCDGSLRRKLPDKLIAAARLVAEDALAGRAPSRVPGATHYHADYVSPYWAPSLTRVSRIGAHIFYRQSGVGRAATVTTFARTDEPPPPPGATEAAVPDRAAAHGFAPWGLPATAVRPPR